jgi:AcrR family transcriptional regulator
MAGPNHLSAPTRGHRKKERTRRLLIAAGQRALADKGEALTVSDVVAEADVSNGTFYNYFVDRDDLVDALAADLVLTLAAAAAREPITDPAVRFALASARVLRRATDDPTWGRVVMRLVHRAPVQSNLDRYLREDLEEGLAQGRFGSGADDATVDLATGLLVMTIRRIVEGEAQPHTARRALERVLRALGVAEEEVGALASAAWTRATGE